MKIPRNNNKRWYARPLCVWTAVFTFVSLHAGPGVSLSRAADRVVDEEAEQVLTRGPVHEAFAETIVFKPTPGILVPKAPPAVIEEVPPEQRPDGDHVTWIPGYWGWEDENAEFLWVSGIWRNLPPGRQWVPGYWEETDNQYRWISGYWADSGKEVVEYLPEPPDTLEKGPNIKRPSSNSTWIPGNWMWYDTSYRWRPGYWETARADWLWVPSYYNWTPYGYVYVDGYWDYPVVRRGLVFAPVRYTRAVYMEPNYYYQPSLVISLAVLTDHLFLRPRHRHYYFGDYYEPRYRRSGYYPYHTYYSGGYGYDPIYAHQRWIHRDDDRWERRRQENYIFFRDNAGERPPRTLAAFREYTRNPDRQLRFDRNFATPITTLATNTESPLRLRPVDDQERQRFVTKGREMRDFREEWKRRGKTDVAPGRERPAGEAPARVQLPRSPIVADTQRSAEDTPPERPRRSERPGQDSAPGDRPGEPGRTVQPGETPPRDPGTERPGRDPNADPGEAPRRDPKADPGETPRRDPKADPGETPRRDPKADPGETPRRDPKADPGETPRRDPRAEPGETPRRDPRAEPGETPRRDPKADPGETPRRDPKADPGETPRRDPQVTPREEPSNKPRIAPKDDPRPETSEEPRREPRVTPKVEPREQPRATPKVQPREQPRATPKVEPRPQPRATPKVEPRQQPRATTKVEPRQQPRATPKVESRQQPRATPKVEPRQQPRVSPPTAPKSQPRQQPPATPRERPATPRTTSPEEREKGKEKRPR
jgi:hypothetical protein